MRGMGRIMANLPMGFDLAAPFQRRLSRITLRCWKDNQRASILPPLFRGGYDYRFVDAAAAG